MCLSLICFSLSISVVHSASRLPNLRWETLHMSPRLHTSKCQQFTSYYTLILMNGKVKTASQGHEASMGEQGVQSSVRKPCQCTKIQAIDPEVFYDRSQYFYHHTPYLTKLPLHYINFHAIKKVFQILSTAFCLIQPPKISCQHPQISTPPCLYSPFPKI